MSPVPEAAGDAGEAMVTSTEPSGAEPSGGMSARTRWLTVVVAAASVLLVDQLTKWWAVSTLAPPPEGDGRMIDLVWTVRLRYAENTGMAFSQGAEAGRWIALVVVVIIAVLLVMVTRTASTAQVVLIGVVIGGALGNLSDRLLRSSGALLDGAVVDFIDVQWWPVFNVADAAVVCGGLLLVWFGTRDPRHHHPGTAPAEAADTRGTRDGV